MHDPMCVAFTARVPLPRRGWATKNAPRFGVERARYTNPSHAGVPIYPWWRPKGYSVHAFGKRWRWATFATIWHVEPRGADSGEVCKHWRDGKPDHRWRWHVRHWKVQVHPVLAVSRRFERCGECGRRMNKAVRFGYMSGDATYHRECMDLRHLRSQREDADAFIVHLFHGLRAALDLDEDEALTQVSRVPDPGWRLGRERRRLQQRLGWEINEAGKFVRSSKPVLVDNSTP